MTRTFNFGKVDYNHSGRKNCPVTVTIELREQANGQQCFSAHGEIWNPRKTDCYVGGQCLDTILKFVHSEKFKTIHRLWQHYHLNAMHAGTEAQEAALKNWESAKYKGFKEQLKYLESLGLEPDNGYHYGSGWLYREIPEEDLNIIKELLTEGVTTL